MKDRAGRHRVARHLFKADSLGGQLQIVVFGSSLGAMLVFDRGGDAVSHLDDVALADQAEPIRPERHAPLNENALFNSSARFIDELMHGSAFERVEVLVPRMVEVDEAALPGAIAPVLQCGDHHQVGLGPGGNLVLHMVAKKDRRARKIRARLMFGALFAPIKRATRFQSTPSLEQIHSLFFCRETESD